MIHIIISLQVCNSQIIREYCYSSLNKRDLARKRRPGTHCRGSIKRIKTCLHFLWSLCHTVPLIDYTTCCQSGGLFFCALLSPSPPNPHPYLCPFDTPSFSFPLSHKVINWLILYTASWRVPKQWKCHYRKTTGLTMNFSYFSLYWAPPYSQSLRIAWPWQIIDQDGSD